MQRDRCRVNIRDTGVWIWDEEVPMSKRNKQQHEHNGQGDECRGSVCDNTLAKTL
jgi:hypothetical protein